ncbi:MAG: hypothetical protein GY820_29940 [Gammaproteobacteria bacterium]|nr:hypothetical protein [Gammaproteobacteria bacterium]
MPRVGNYLGQFVDELESDYGVGSYISELAAAGPKNYAFKVLTPMGEEKEVVKVRGHTINHDTSAILNFATMKELVMQFVQGGEENAEKMVPYKQICRKEGLVVLTRTMHKCQRVVYNKRMVKNDFSTVPYGYL